MATLDPEKELKDKIEAITKAIRKHSAISFRKDDGEKETMEPFVLGIKKENNAHVVKGYKNFPLELSDKAENWRTYELNQIHEVKATMVRSKSMRKYFDPDDVIMSSIISAIPGFEPSIR